MSTAVCNRSDSESVSDAPSGMRLDSPTPPRATSPSEQEPEETDKMVEDDGYGDDAVGKFCRANALDKHMPAYLRRLGDIRGVRAIADVIHPHLPAQCNPSAVISARITKRLQAPPVYDKFTPPTVLEPEELPLVLILADGTEQCSRCREALPSPRPVACPSCGGCLSSGLTHTQPGWYNEQPFPGYVPPPRPMDARGSGPSYESSRKSKSGGHSEARKIAVGHSRLRSASASSASDSASSASIHLLRGPPRRRRRRHAVQQCTTPRPDNERIITVDQLDAMVSRTVVTTISDSECSSPAHRSSVSSSSGPIPICNLPIETSSSPDRKGKRLRYRPPSSQRSSPTHGQDSLNVNSTQRRWNRRNGNGLAKRHRRRSTSTIVGVGAAAHTQLSIKEQFPPEIVDTPPKAVPIARTKPRGSTAPAPKGQEKEDSVMELRTAAEQAAAKAAEFRESAKQAFAAKCKAADAEDYMVAKEHLRRQQGFEESAKAEEAAAAAFTKRATVALERDVARATAAAAVAIAAVITAAQPPPQPSPQILAAVAAAALIWQDARTESNAKLTQKAEGLLSQYLSLKQEAVANEDYIEAKRIKTFCSTLQCALQTHRTNTLAPVAMP